MQLWVYCKKDAGGVSDPPFAQLNELALILASVAKPMAARGAPKADFLWHRSDGTLADLALRRFPHGDLSALPVGMALEPPNSAQVVDGAAKASTADDYVREGAPVATPHNIAATLAAGTMGDVVRIFDPGFKARTKALCQRVGDPMGKSDGLTRDCEACQTQTTEGFKIRGTHHFPAVNLAITQVRKGRAANIVEKEVDLWCAAGLGYKPPTEAQEVAARQEAKANEGKLARCARQENRASMSPVRRLIAEATSPGPRKSAETAPDTRSGPKELLEFVDEYVLGSEVRDQQGNSPATNIRRLHPPSDMLVCINCASPVIVAMKRRGYPEMDKELILWLETCQFAQSTTRILRSVTASEEVWPNDRGDIFKRGSDALLKGRAVQEDREGGLWTGKVILVLPASAEPGSSSSAYIYPDPDGDSAKKSASRTNAPTREVERWEIERTKAACARAIEAAQARSQEAMNKCMVTIEEVEAANTSGEQLAVIENLGGVIYTMPKELLFDGPWVGNSEAQVTVWTKNKNGKIAEKKAANAKASALGLARDNEWERLAVELAGLEVDGAEGGPRRGPYLDKARMWNADRAKPRKRNLYFRPLDEPALADGQVDGDNGREKQRPRGTSPIRPAGGTREVTPQSEQQGEDADDPQMDEPAAPHPRGLASASLLNSTAERAGNGPVDPGPSELRADQTAGPVLEAGMRAGGWR